MRLKTSTFYLFILFSFIVLFDTVNAFSQDQKDVVLSNDNCKNTQTFLFGENIRVFNMGNQINSKFDEYNPVLNHTRTFMLYTSRRDSTTGQDIYQEDGDYYEDIMISKREGRRFRSASLLDENDPIFSTTINTAKHEAPVWISDDEKLLIIYKQDMLWFSIKKDSGYTEPEKFSKNVNFSNYQRHASITADGNKIYFSAEGKYPTTGRVNFNIYECSKQENGSWSKPMLVPGLINSVYNEDSPEVSPDGKTMYFSSDHPDGFGGYDIYFSTLENGEWTQPLNICEPINSAGSDIFFKLSDDGAYAYFSSDRLGGNGGQDIYKLVIDKPTFTDCEPYSKTVKEDGLVMSSRDTVLAKSQVAFDGSSSHFNQQTPSAWYWKIGDQIIKNEKIVEPTFSEPGVYDVSMQLSYVNSEHLDVELKCATKKVTVLNKEQYENYLNGKGGIVGMQALVGQDEVLLQMENTVTNNPFELKPEAENTFINTPVDVYTLANDVHPEGSPLKLVSVESPLNGIVLIEDANQGIAVYRPAKDFVGVDKFYYVAEDDQGMQARSFTAIQVFNEESFMSNQSVKNDEGITKEDSAITLNVLANDGSPFGGVLAINKVGKTPNGTIEIIDSNTGEVKYTPKPGFTGKDVFTYTTLDADGKQNAATVTITVGEDNSELIGVKNLKYTKMDESITFGVMSNDVQSKGLPMKVSGVTPPANGYIKILNAESGRVLYTPKKGFVGTDAFTYSLSDSDGNKAIVPVNVIVAPEQGMQGIAAKPDQGSTEAGKPITISLFDNDMAGADGIRLSSIDQPTNGSIVVKDSLKGIVEFTPNPGFVGFEKFNYSILDKSGNKAKSSVKIDVVEDGQIILALNNDRTETQQDEPVDLNILNNDSHSAGYALVIESVEKPQHGTVEVIDPNIGLIRYVPDFGYGGADFFTYTAIDKDGNTSTAQILINVIEPMLASNISTEELPDLALNPIYFDFDKSYIRTDAREILDENIRILKQNPDLIIKVLSHCDSRGSLKYNVALSQRRAKSTVDYMVENGISKDRIIAVLGMGETQLVNDCDGSVWCPPSDHQLNRRSDFVIAAKKK